MTVHIFIGTDPGVVKDEYGTIVFDVNNAPKHDEVILCDNAVQADEAQESLNRLGLQSKRYYMKNGVLVKDTVEELLDEEGNQILDYWASSIDTVLPLNAELTTLKANILTDWARLVAIKANTKRA